MDVKTGIDALGYKQVVDYYVWTSPFANVSVFTSDTKLINQRVKSCNDPKLEYLHILIVLIIFFVIDWHRLLILDAHFSKVCSNILSFCTENRVNWVPVLTRLKGSVVSFVSADHRKTPRENNMFARKMWTLRRMRRRRRSVFYSKPDHFGISCHLWELCSELPYGFVMTGRWQRRRRRKKNKMRSKCREWEKERRSVRVK